MYRRGNPCATVVRTCTGCAWYFQTDRRNCSLSSAGWSESEKAHRGSSRAGKRSKREVRLSRHAVDAPAVLPVGGRDSKPIFLRIVPDRNPRTECSCQPVAFIISWALAARPLSSSRILAALLASCGPEIRISPRRLTVTRGKRTDVYVWPFGPPNCMKMVVSGGRRREAGATLEDHSEDVFGSRTPKRTDDWARGLPRAVDQRSPRA